MRTVLENLGQVAQYIVGIRSDPDGLASAGAAGGCDCRADCIGFVDFHQTTECINAAATPLVGGVGDEHIGTAVSGRQNGAIRISFADLAAQCVVTIGGDSALRAAGHTLQTTALVNEVYLRLVDVKAVSWQDRAHFFAISARMMRRVLTDFARSRNYQKRGGGAMQISLDEGLVVTQEKDADILALDEALSRFAEVYPRQSQVVELRIGGLSLSCLAYDALGIFRSELPTSAFLANF